MKFQRKKGIKMKVKEWLQDLEYEYQVQKLAISFKEWLEEKGYL